MPLDGSEKELIEAAAAYKKAADEVKTAAEKTGTELKALGTVTNETKAAADKALLDLGGINTRITEIEQKMARRGAGGEPPMERKSIGQQAIEHDSVKALMQNKRGTARLEVKAIVSAVNTDTLGAAGDLLTPDRRGLLTMPERRMTVRDLITPGQTTSNAIQYPQETGFVNAAATVSEVLGTIKPQSDIKFDIKNTAVTTVAHFMMATKQILDDAPQLRSFIDGRLRYGLRFVEEMQLLMGAGTGTDLTGLYTTATLYSAPFVPAGTPTMIDQLRLALLQASLAEFPSTGIILNPMDWARAELLKDTSNQYLFANIQGTVQPMLWGVPVVETQAMTIDKFMVGAFRLGAQIFDREEVGVEISTEDRDNFIRNLVTIRAEQRLALATYRPEAFVKGDLGFVV